MTVPSLEIIIDSKDVSVTNDMLSEKLSGLSMVEFLETRVSPWLAARAKARFAREGDDASGTWQELQGNTQFVRSEGTKLGYWDVGPDHPINVRTHALENWITQGHGIAAPLGYGATLIYPGNPKSRDLKDKISTAQSGSSKPGTVPRPVLAIGITDISEILTMMRDWIIV